MDQIKELTKLAKQALRIAESVPASRVEPFRHTSIASVVTISNPDANAFSQGVFDKAAEMEKLGMTEVEIQYSTNLFGNSSAGPVLIHCALLIGRK